MKRNTGERCYYQISLPPPISEKLDIMAQKRCTPKATLVKLAIQAYIAHEHEDTPTCANGTRCLCPNMWARTSKPPSNER